MQLAVQVYGVAVNDPDVGKGRGRKGEEQGHGDAEHGARGYYETPPP